MEIKEWVSTARKHKKLTQEQLATRLSLTKANISAWETGRHQPSFNQLRMVEAITGFPLMQQDAGPRPEQVRIDHFFPAVQPQVWDALTEREKSMVEMKVLEAVQFVLALRVPAASHAADSGNDAGRQTPPPQSAAM